MTLGEPIQQIVAFVDDDRQTAIEWIMRMSQAEQHQRRRHSPALVATIANAAWESAAGRDEPWRIDSRDLHERLHHRGRAVAHAREIRETAATKSHFRCARHGQNSQPNWYARSR